ncbi:Ectoine utilization protein EutD [Neorhizobium galegae bv. officinalis]|uniref:Ectoine utilization protein EutD n=1 Tax=Neorhizobium galegae bv. officinalis TaxID=323656 RepID=A0A0T7G0G1_NEOGA|nr:Xaa-Pro peptidase family protein [Neorhizobium galegae]CDZ40795.1 Ectoine utilization protein EutD [Neorhizobium galegae bv. officinalis]CDZ54627.1 Ectoine utilization protein EutD [Neorhizobium galegae bv. officinalis]
MENELRFEKAEFSTRLLVVKKEMEKRGIDVLLLSEPSNANYLTGYDAYSFYVPQMVLVALNHDEPVWVGRGMDGVSARMTTYLSQANIRPFPDAYVQSALSPYDFVAEVVKEVAGPKVKIGVEMGGYYYSARAHADLVNALPDATFFDADLLVNWIRLIKSPAEVALMRDAGKIADAMMHRAIDIVEPGVRECDIAAVVYHQMMAGTPDFGGNYTCSPIYLCVGEKALAPHAAWSDKPLPAKTIINLELFGNRHRYQVNLARTICVGTPTQSYQNLADVVVEALNAGLEAVAPGKTAEEVHAAFAKTLAKHGHEKEARLGYSLGLGYPPAVGEKTVSLRKGDQTVLEPGMCFHMMSGLWLENDGITITQPFVVTERGHEPLTQIPRKLFIK